MPSEQLSFPQPHKRSYSAADFFPGAPSEVARAMLDDPESWPNGKLLLSGDSGSGKSHLLHIWAETEGANLVQWDAVPSRAEGPVAVDDAHLVAGDKDREEALFHLHNNLAQAGHALLLAAPLPPKDWGIRLPDLKSRMDATTIARIEPPDDETLTALLLKLMADRQLDPAPALPRYLVRRMGRSYAEAMRIVDALDGLSLSERRNVTTSLASRVLDA